ncbi:phosphate signaling complex protein PhoU [Pontibacillus salicampi]|uniref:Phosphate-specific transport system accessory protein PhoU n=1 Tax=Pontibacillus salicampi TaxID=1449801 RepID=A0ABV6LJT7_9BACI
MALRGQFYDELASLQFNIKKLAVNCVNAFEQSIDSLYDHDVEKAQQIIENDQYLDQEEVAINEKAILLIARQQPVATDLRRLIVAIKTSTDLERMADHATNIAKSTIHLGKEHDLPINPALREMANQAMEMVDVATKAFEHEDISLARTLADMDDKVDNMYGKITKELMELSADHPQNIQHIMQLAFVGRYIERFADHITNIGENIFYIVKGETFDLNE